MITSLVIDMRLRCGLRGRLGLLLLAFVLDNPAFVVFWALHGGSSFASRLLHHAGQDVGTGFGALSQNSTPRNNKSRFSGGLRTRKNFEQVRDRLREEKRRSTTTSERRQTIFFGISTLGRFPDGNSVSFNHKTKKKKDSGEDQEKLRYE